jgi:uncharacterized protein (TIGR02145 family)
MIVKIFRTMFAIVALHMMSFICIYSQLKEPYNTVKIQGKEWMRFNLNKKHFNTGDSIKEAKTALEWVTAYKNKEPAYCQYPNSNGKYGLLYNIHAIKDFRGLAPDGFRIAKCEDWKSIYSLHDDSSATCLKANEGYFSGNMLYGFNALPGGYRAPVSDYVQFWGHDYMSIWWSESDECKSIMYGDLSAIHIYKGYSLSDAVGAYVRCIKE